MVHSYLRHGPTQAFGIICSASSNSRYHRGLAYVPALEDVLVWDVKKGQMLSMWHETGHTAEVTCILQAPRKDSFAVGYSDGSIRIWNPISLSVVITLNGHQKSVTALAFDEEGTRLASGSQDTDLIVWDLVAESGLYRLHGHRDQITAIHFLTASDLPSISILPTSNFLLTSSKDTFLKLWDLSSQHCIQTIIAHRSEIWSMDINAKRDMVFTGSGEGELKAWRIDRRALAQGVRETENGEIVKIIYPISSLPLASRHRVSQITFHPGQPFLAVQSHDRSVEIFRIRTEEEIQKKRLRREKRAKEKKALSQGNLEKEIDGDEAALKDPDSNEDEIKLVDLFTPHVVVHATGKIRSFDFGEAIVKRSVQILLALFSNALEVYAVPFPDRSKEPQEAARAFVLDLPGHRTDVRTLSLTSDDQILASASNGSLKLWNMKTTACIRTMDCGNSICSTFLPGDRHIALGTKAGEILIYDISSSALVETVQAHTGTVWSLHMRADQRALVSGSADKDVKFWELQQKQGTGENIQDGNLLSLVHVRTLKMTDDVLSVRCSPNGKLLAVSLLDSTVKVFYEDTLKFFLSLYGHKLPVLAMDISSDSKLIVTCSADKNVKIWGLDFGDCHKSIFAHGESVMQVAFEKGSHYFWTVGKDRMAKYWDGDKFENIQNLEGHHSEIWALAVSHRGTFVVTASHDKSIRVWEKLDEPLFLEEERERELEALHEKEIADSLNHPNMLISDRADSNQAPSVQVTAVSKQTTETLMAGERIIEALDLADNERAALQSYRDDMAKLPEDDAMRLQPPPRNPVLATYDLQPDEWVLRVIEKVPSTALHDALLVLPFGKVVSLMYYLNIWAQKDLNIILVSRIIFFLLKTHHHQIVANRVMRTVLIPLRKHLRFALQRQKDIIGYNLAALQYMRRRNDSDRFAEFHEGVMEEERVRAEISEGKKRKRVQLKG